MTLFPLLNRPEPYTDESLASLVSRLALANHYPTTRWIIHFLPLAEAYRRTPNLNLIRELGVFKCLAHLTRLPVDDLIGLSLHHFVPALQGDQSGPWLTRGMGNEFGRSPVTGQVCPRCLEEHAYLRRHWDLRLVAACLQHRVLLVEQCPACGSPVNTHRLIAVQCVRCGYDLRQAPVLSLEDDAAGLAAQARLWADHGLASDDAPLWPDTSPLSTLPRPQRFALRRALHYTLLELPLDSPALPPARLDLASVWPGRRGASRRRWLPNAVRYLLATATDRVLSDWPQGFYTLLDAMRRVDRSGHTGVQRDFGVWYTGWLRKELIGPAFDFVCAAFFDYLETHYDGGYLQKIGRFRRMSRAAATSRSYYPRTQALQRLGLGGKDLDEWVVAGVVHAVIGPLGRGERRMYLVAGHEIQACLNARGDRLTLHQTQARLGLQRPAVEALVAAGLLRPEGDQVDRGPAFWLFSPPAIDDVIERYTALADAPPPQAAEKSVSLIEAVYLMRSVAKNVGEFLGLVTQGRLKPRLRQGQCGLGQLAFSRAELAECRRALSGFTYAWVAERLSVRPRDVRRWIKAGWLQSVNPDRIAPESYAAFRETYMTSAEVLALVGLCQRTLYVWVKRGLVHPCESPEPRRRGCHLFRRAEIEALAPSNRLSVSETARRLGLGPRQINYLAKQGRLKAIAGPTINGYGTHLFLRSEVERAQQLMLSTENGLWERRPHPRVRPGPQLVEISNATTGPP